MSKSLDDFIVYSAARQINENIIHEAIYFVIPDEQTINVINGILANEYLGYDNADYIDDVMSKTNHLDEHLRLIFIRNALDDYNHYSVV